MAQGVSGGSSYQQDFVKSWTNRVNQAQQAGIDPNKLKAIIQNDWRRVQNGDSPYNDTQAGLAVHSMLTGKPLINVDNSNKGDGLLGGITSAIGNIPDDIGNVASGLNPITLIPNLYKQGEAAVNNPERLLKPIEKLAGGDITGALQTASKTPLLDLIPGVYTAKNVLTGDWNEIVKHPVMTGLDVLPYAGEVGKLAMAGRAIEGSDAAAALADSGKLRGTVEPQSPSAALLEGKPLKAAFRAAGGTTDSPLSYRWFKARADAASVMGDTKPLLYGDADAPNGARVVAGENGGVIENPPVPQSFGKQGKGAGSAWVNNLTKQADKAGMPLEVTINGTHDAAINMYGRHGFEPVSTIPGSAGPATFEVPFVETGSSRAEAAEAAAQAHANIPNDKIRIFRGLDGTGGMRAGEEGAVGRWWTPSYQYAVDYGKGREGGVANGIIAQDVTRAEFEKFTKGNGLTADFDKIKAGQTAPNEVAGLYTPTAEFIAPKSLGTSDQVVLRREPVAPNLPKVYRTSDITARIAEKYGFDMETRELNRLHAILKRKEGEEGLGIGKDYDSWFEGLSDEDRATVLHAAQRFNPNGLNAEMGEKFTPAMRDIVEHARQHVDELAEPYTYDPWEEARQREAQADEHGKNEEFEPEGTAVKENKRFVAIPNDGGSVDVYPIGGDVGRSYQAVFEKQRRVEPLKTNLDNAQAKLDAAAEAGTEPTEAMWRAHERAQVKYDAANKDLTKAQELFGKIHNRAAPARYGELLKDQFKGKLQSRVDQMGEGQTVFRRTNQSIIDDIQNSQGSYVGFDPRDWEAAGEGRPLTEDTLRPRNPLDVKAVHTDEGLGEAVLRHFQQSDAGRVIGERAASGDVAGAITYAEEHLGVEFTPEEVDALLHGMDKSKAAPVEGAYDFSEGMRATFDDAQKQKDAIRKFEELPDDAPVVVYHGTTAEHAQALAEGREIGPGHEQTGSRGLYVAPTPKDARVYGDTIVRFVVPKSALEVSAEAGGNATVGHAFMNTHGGAIVPEGYAIEGAVDVGPRAKFAEGSLSAPKVSSGQMQDIVAAKLARDMGHDVAVKHVNVGDNINPEWKPHEATVLDKSALQSTQKEPVLTAEQAGKAAEAITNNNFGYLVDQGIITSNELHGMMDDVMSNWQELARQGHDPVYVPHVPESKVPYLLDQKPLAGNLYTPRQFLSKDTLSFAPQAQDMAIALTSYAKEILKEKSSLEMFKAVKSMAVTQKQLVDRFGLERATRMLSTDYIPYSETAGRYLSKPEMALLPDSEQLYIPRVLNTNLDHMMNAFDRNPAFGTYDKAMKVYKFGVLTGPRHVAHVLFGGLAFMMGEHGVTAFPKFLEALKAVRSGDIFAGLSRGLDYFTPEEWATMGEGKTMGRLLVKAVGSPFKALAKFEETIANTQRMMTYLRELDKGAKAGLDTSAAEAAAMKLTNKVYMDIDGMAPLERTVLRHVFPFYSFTKHIIRYVLNYPADHPWRAATLSNIARIEQEDHQSGLPAIFNDFLFLGDTDKAGNQHAIDVKNLNPFRSLDGQNPLTLAGFLSALSPAFTVPAQLAGLNTLTATPDLYPNLDYDPRTGKLIASHPDMAAQGLQLAFPPAGALEGILGLSENWRQLKKSDPDAYNRALMSAMNLPFIPQKRNLGVERGKAEANRYRAAQGALSDALRTGNTGELANYNVVPFQGQLVSSSVMTRLIEAIKKQNPGISPASVIPRSHGKGSLGAALAGQK